MQPGNKPENEPGNENDRFEHYLRQFQPRPPAPLPKMGAVAPKSHRFQLAVAALVLLACGIAIWSGRYAAQVLPPQGGAAVLRERGPGSAASLGKLNRLIQEDPAQLDSVLAELSLSILPDVMEPNGSLRALAKE